MMMNQSGGEIWNWNKTEQMNSILSCVRRFRYVALDTEFPGHLKETRVEANSEERYSDMKFNVDRTKVIQLGFTFFDDQGRVGGTWEVNLSDFDVTKDSRNVKSIEFLKRNGLNFEKIREEGVKANEFFKAFAQIIKEKEMVWVTFQGSYDLAYLVKGLIGGRLLPESSRSFGELVERFFGEVRDVKEMAGRCRSVNQRFGLEKMASELGIRRLGDAHHAGSDSELTARVYAEMIVMLDVQSFEDEQRLEDELKMKNFYQLQPQTMLIHPYFVERRFLVPVPRMFYVEI